MKKLPNFLVEAISGREDFKGWHLLTVGEYVESDFDFVGFIDKFGDTLNPFSSICEVYLDQQNELKELPLTKIWRSMIGDDVIPFCLTERTQKYDRTYYELASQIALHEAKVRRRPAASSPSFQKISEDADI